MADTNPTSATTTAEITSIIPITSGTVATYDPKMPWESTTYWGLLVVLVTWAVKKWGPAALQNDETIKTILEILSMLVGAGLVAYGRWKATRPLSTSSTPVTTTVS